MRCFALPLAPQGLSADERTGQTCGDDAGEFDGAIVLDGLRDIEVDISHNVIEGSEIPFRIRDSSARLSYNRTRGSRNRLMVEDDSNVRSERNDYG